MKITKTTIEITPQEFEHLLSIPFEFSAPVLGKIRRLCESDIKEMTISKNDARKQRALIKELRSA